MKNFSLILTMFAYTFFMQIQAKTTYIPTYKNRLLLIENGEVDSLTNKSHTLVMSSKDGLITCAMIQQVVSQDLINDIKTTKSAAGWYKVAAILSSISESIAQDQMSNGYDQGWAMQNYMNAREDTNASIVASINAKAQAENLKTLLLYFVIKNNSHKEILITDMDRGLVWFVLPHCETHLPLSKNEECHFRISSCNPLDENVKYVHAYGTNILEKYKVSLETDLSWYIPISNKALQALQFETNQQSGYIKIDKETMSINIFSDEEFKNIKKNACKN